MKRSKLAASLLAITVAVSTLVTGCAKVPETSDNSNSGNNSTPDSSAPGSSNDKPDDGNSTPDTPPAEGPALEFAPGTVLRMATGYNSPKTGLFFDSETAGSGVTLANGKTYNTGDLKPTWVAVQEKLGMEFEDKYQGNNGTKEYEYWQNQLDQIDMLSSTASLLTEGGVAGQFVNLADYLDSMPDFKAYLEANPIVRLSITGDVETGAIYFSPYFDGVNDIERMPLMRVDWVQKLLDGEGDFAADASNNTAAPVYQPYMPTSSKVDIPVVEKDGKTVKTISKDYDKGGNIIAKMNEVGAMSGVDAVNMLRKYIDETYDGYYGTTRSDLFVGQNAAWDADELVALLRCVVANPQTLNGTDTVEGLFSREDGSNQRRVDMYRFAGTLFGVRGLESRQDYLYVGNDNKLHDARMDAETYVALDRMNAMVNEGLLSKDFVSVTESKDLGTSQQYLENDAGFMHYDYNQTQTAHNKTKLDTANGEKYMAAMVPVARWNDGTGEQFMRFTESWRSVKTDGWGISKAGVGDDTDKLNAALSLINYAFSEEGQILMSYGPEEFRKSSTFMFNGKEMPEISDDTYTELWEKAKGSYTDYARQYLGSTLSFAKSQAFEFQCTTPEGREGAGFISNAIAAGTIKHPELALTENPWYTSVPTTLPLTKTDNDTIKNYTMLGGSGKFGQSKEQENLFVNIIAKGYSGDGTGSAAETIETISGAWGAADVLEIREIGWEELLAYFDTL
ncbi:MAG: hypothetical protein K2N38_08675 [Oscillospiraceae bacterium]|nr:hypothetical protein [Oscillospiraceae bacterium]